MSLVPTGQPVTPLTEEEQVEEEELREKYEYENDRTVHEFTDEEPVRHDVYPETDDEKYENDVPKINPRENVRRGSRNLFKGQRFFTPTAFKEYVLDHALKEGRNLKQYRWDTNKCAFQCVGRNCNWRVYCSLRKGCSMWQIQGYNFTHSCVPNGECEMLKSPVIARLFVDKIRQEPDYFQPMKIEELIKEKWKITPSRPQCQAGRTKALQWIEKEYDEQFARLRDYGAELLQSNPNSTVHIETLKNAKNLDEFNRMYVCFDTLRRSWKQHCRPLIGVDGCFLRGKMKGQFLVALGRDGDNAIYPIAWAVVQVENIPNWTWFVQKVKVDLELGDGDGYVLVSDRQKGLIRAVEVELPKIEHRMCVRHIYANLKARHGKLPELKPLIWTLAWSYNAGDYRERLRRIREYDQAVYEDVLRSNPKTWCRAFYKLGPCCEDVENNSTESFNATIVKAREKPLVPLLELVARLAMVRIFKRSVVSHNHEPLVTPYAKKFLEAEHDEAANCRVFRSTNNMFEVVLGGSSFRVSLERKSCSCKKWEITGIPCEHAYGVLLHRNLQPEEYVANWFKTDRWRNTYVNGVIPIQGPKFWPTNTGPEVFQPPPPPQPGRKKKGKKVKRKRGVNESPPRKLTKKRTMHCGICGEANHNSRSRIHKKDTMVGEQGAQTSQVQGGEDQSSQVFTQSTSQVQGGEAQSSQVFTQPEF